MKLSKDMLRFLDENYTGNTGKTYATAERFLRSMAEHESEWGCDFTLQPTNVLQAAFDDAVGAKQYYAVMRLNLLKEYAQWRKKNGLPYGDGIFGVKIDTAVAIRSEMVSSPEHLESVLNVIFENPREQTSDIVYRSFLWLGFSGLEDREAVTVTDDEVDFDRYVIVHDGMEYPVYGSEIDDLKAACSAESFYEMTGNNRTIRLYSRQDTRFILRGKATKRATSPEQMLVNTIRPRLAKRIRSAAERKTSDDQAIPYGITFQKVRLSGIFYRFYDIERLHGQPDFTEIIRAEIEQRNREGRAYKTNTTFTENVIINRSQNAYRQNYESWKRAFYGDEQ